jgi:eukaryotic-like serine/threonine-protein kinase
MIGRRIGHYELVERIGWGAESNIFRARDTVTGRVVAIKDVIVREKEKGKYLRHLRNEYDVLRELMAAEPTTNGAPGFVRVYELLSSGILFREKRLSLVMEFVEGKDLRRENRFPMGQLTDFFRQVADTLVKVHGLRFVHGDIKPENIIVGPTGRATLVDFGFSCRAGSKAKSIKGTREYIAPEQVNKGIITELTDIYNFGATMYHLLTAKYLPALLPGPGQDTGFISGAHLRPRDVRDFNPNVPDPLATIVMECCEQEVARRCSSARTLALALKALSEEFG